MGADSPEIAVGAVQGGLYLGLLGRATQRTCPTADHLVNDYLANRPQEPTVMLDLTGCDWVDSTFAGWLVGLGKRMGRMPGGQVRMTGCSERCRASLERMQLAAMFQFEAADAPAETRMVPCTTSDQPDKEELKLMLAAHESLAALSPENEQLFAPIAATLRNQIENT